LSRRNSREAKATRRNKKALRVSPPGYIDLIQYIKDRVNVSTGTARAVIMAGTLRIDSHILGVEQLCGAAPPRTVGMGEELTLRV